MTVSPIVFSTSTPSPPHAADWGDYRYGGGRGDAGRETAGYSYGHRPLPESDVAKVRVGRNEPTHALYESPHTYEYMTNPRKGGRLRQDGTRVPKTERRPPGDDVEYVVDARPPAKGRRRYGRNNRYGNAGGRYDEGGGDGYRHEAKRKRKRKSPPATTTTGRRAVEPEVGSSSKKNVRKDTEKVLDDDDDERPVYEKQTTAKKNGAKGDANDAGNRVKKVRDREEIVGDLDARGKHKIHKKNEYSKKQQFFDEEHVDHGKKKPTLNRDRNKKSHKKRTGHDNVSKKQKRKVMKDTNKDRGKFERVNRRSSQGYGQILAVR